MSKFDDALEIIGQALFEVHEKDIPPEAQNLLNQLDSAYIVVAWPESQELMDEEWFDEEAILDVDGKFGDSAYFIPLKRILYKNNCITITAVKDSWTREELDEVLNRFAVDAMAAALHGLLPSDAKHFTNHWTKENL